MNENLISGLVSGVIVVIISLIFSNIWKGIIVPWFEERVYKDVKIEGKWFSYYTGQMLGRQDIISIKRHGHEINGTMVCMSDCDLGESYSLKGSFKNLLLPLTYENINESKADRGTITLKSTNSANTLIGQICYYSCPDDIVKTTEVTWYRDREEMEEAKLLHEKNLIENFSPEKNVVIEPEVEIANG